MSSSTQHKKDKVKRSTSDNSSSTSYGNGLQISKVGFGRSHKGPVFLKVDRRGPRNKILMKFHDKFSSGNEIILFANGLKMIYAKEGRGYSKGRLAFLHSNSPGFSSGQAQLDAPAPAVGVKVPIQKVDDIVEYLYQALETVTDPKLRSVLIDSIDRFETDKEEVEMSFDSARWEALKQTARHFAERAQDSFSPELMPDNQ